MNTVIQNDSLRVEISPKGGELMSLRAPDGTEYLWQGAAPYWGDRAINLFPYIGRLTDGQYTFAGQPYQMELHGFLRKSRMEVEAQAGDFVVFLLKSGAETLAQYPFAFETRIFYRLEQNKLNIAFEVKNEDEKPMYFGLGGHPGFNVPLEEGKTFTDYWLEFAAPCSPRSVNMSDTCYVMDGSVPFPLEGGTRLPLSHSLFDRDAIMLAGVANAVTLTAGGKRGVTVSYPQMKYLAIWHNPKTEAPFVCIEPWTALPARQGVVEDLATQPDYSILAPGGVCRNEWSIAVR